MTELAARVSVRAGPARWECPCGASDGHPGAPAQTRVRWPRLTAASRRIERFAAARSRRLAIGLGLGFELFERSTHRVGLTIAGRVLQEQAELRAGGAPRPPH